MLLAIRRVREDNNKRTAEALWGFESRENNKRATDDAPDIVPSTTHGCAVTLQPVHQDRYVKDDDTS